MKKVFVCLVGMFAWASFAFADERNTFEIAGEFSDYTYKESHMDYPIKDKGHFQGVSARLTHRSLMSEYFGDNDGFVSLEAIFMTGKVDYSGFMQQTTPSGIVYTPASINGIRDWYVDGRLLLGQRFYFADQKLILDPFIGLAYRFLRADEQKKSASAYRRESNYIYMPIGAAFYWQVTDSFKIGLKGEFDWLLKGTQKSYLSDVDPAFYDVKNNQKKGFGVRASVKLEQEMGKIGLFVEPFFRYWKIQNSEISYYYIEDIGGGWFVYHPAIEPFNITRECGIRAGITF